MTRIVITIAAAILFFLVLSSCYVVGEGQQSVVTQFGRPVQTATEPGLYFKIPLIQDVTLLEKRLLPWDGNAESMQTRDKKRIFIDVWARWRILDPEKFFTAVRTEQKGQKMLDDLIDSAVRDVVARHNLIDAVRTTNEELIYESEEMKAVARSATTRDVVTIGRAEMEAEILKAVTQDLEKNNYGMEVVSVRVKRVNYVQSVKDTVYGRMRSERERIAQLFQSEAEEDRNRIQGLTRKELDTIEGEMKQKSSEIRGKADAAVIKLAAEAYGQSPEFYTFLKQLDIYKTSLAEGTKLILSTDSDLLRMIKKVEQAK